MVAGESRSFLRASVALSCSLMARMNNASRDILDTSVSAVETLLVRGKQNLRRTLGKLTDEDE